MIRAKRRQLKRLMISSSETAIPAGRPDQVAETAAQLCWRLLRPETCRPPARPCLASHHSPGIAAE
jgi:hypothetical protein